MTALLIALAVAACLIALAALLWSPQPKPPLVHIDTGPKTPAPLVDGPKPELVEKQPTTVDAVVAWEIVRRRLVTSGLDEDEIDQLDSTVAPQLFKASKTTK